MVIRRIFLFVLFLFLSSSSFAQHQHETPPQTQAEQKPSSDHAEHEMHHENPASMFFMSQGAGTAVNPVTREKHLMRKLGGDWNFMWHGYAFLNVIEQSGPRGDDDVFSTNHLMLMFERETSATSSFFVRTMFSFEPATTQDGKYPLLFQTGETADGEPIIDGQHPHDLFMELSAQYAMEIRPELLFHMYGGLRGDPALGPVAFPHRISALELPQAVLSHHLQDSTHIADNVLTAGLKYKTMRFEFSGFHGREPDEDRWDLDPGAIDSWSTRITFTPTQNWVAQVSTGRLHEPEELEPGDIHRTTFSVTQNHPVSDGFVASSFVWGWNRKLAVDLDVYSYLFESLWQFKGKNYLTGRLEIVDKEELFADHHAPVEENEELADEVFNIKAFTIGYARDFNLIPNLQTGVGANVTFYGTPSELDPFYGENPKGFFFYIRIRGGQH